MKDLKIPESPITPKIEFLADSGELMFRGISQPEDSSEFYAPVVKWLSEYLRDTKRHVKLVFKLDYFNTASAKILVEVLSLAGERKKSKGNVEVTWYYEAYDEDMGEAVDILSEIADIEIVKICT